ncbi:TetR/AcrR family transcriptional regulator [Nocardia amikacinitolerans]|uniref:TetR/AcrR family transcriptional regulator n=1 Tax=Nocardia amikacinitolerans TaxID=756689 RepID=UPI0020A30348|nr:TetR/AcrR family transcriptional regulator C-terminal domain-containing protein [Nocardia amikacinitolerans]MCP2288691.1 transcriptional regulator, TetR family [Nocardia amikacinitolerans]
MARPRHPLLTRARIVATALALLDAEGMAAVSTRRIAAELGVQGPSLYNHVGTKDELIDAIADTVLGEVDTRMFAALGPENSDWRTALWDWAYSYRAAMAAHPNIVPALAGGPGHRPNALRIADAVFGGLVAAGWPRREATTVGALMRYFITGSALASFAAGFPADATVYGGDYPHLSEAHLLADRQHRIDEDAFEVGLRALLDGLDDRYRAVRDALPDRR